MENFSVQQLGTRIDVQIIQFVIFFHTAGNIQDLPTNNPPTDALTTDAAPQMQGIYYIHIIMQHAYPTVT